MTGSSPIDSPSDAKTLIASLRRLGRVAVAFSAGVDSAVVCQAAALGCGDDAVAVTGVSPSLASGELDQARELAARMGIRHVVLNTDEFDDPRYVSNPANRCRFCKTELYTRIHERQAELQFDVIVNGANVDDRGDYRPGMQAATEFGVVSPLLDTGLNKERVRALARFWDLPVWDKPATPCLSSRIAYGVAVTPERLRRVDRAEQFLRREFSLKIVRVRTDADDSARIEVPTERIPELSDALARVTAALTNMGFSSVSVDPAGFRSGSLNESLPLVTLNAPTD